jgi:hypothetical protein
MSESDIDELFRLSGLEVPETKREEKIDALIKLLGSEE